MNTHLTYQIHDLRPGTDPVSLLSHVAEGFVASIHKQVADAAAATKGYAETLQMYWFNDGYAIERREDLPGFSVTFSSLAGTANASSEAWPHWFAVLGQYSLQAAAYAVTCSATETADTARAYAELANLRFCVLDGRLVQVSNEAQRVFGDDWSASFAELPVAQRKVVDRVVRSNACSCAVCERRRLIESDPDAAASLPKHLARFRDGELASHFHHLRTHPRRWQVLLAATGHAKRFVRREAWNHLGLSLLSDRGLPPDPAVIDAVVEQLPAALAAGNLDHGLSEFTWTLEQVAGFHPASIDRVVAALLQAPPPKPGEKPRPRAALAKLVASVAATFPQHATTLEPLLARYASVLDATKPPVVGGLRLKLVADERLRVFAGSTELCTIPGSRIEQVVELTPPSTANQVIELSARTEDGQLVRSSYGDGTLVLRLPATGTLSASIRNRAWLTYNFALG